MLEKYREKLDKIDNEIIQLIAKRSEVIKKVALYKKQNNIPRHQPKREKELLEAKMNLARKNNIDPKFIHDIFKKIIKYSRHVQKSIIGK